MPDKTPKNPVPAVANASDWSRPVAEINATVRRAEAGDASALTAVRTLLALAGSADALGGNVAETALRALTRAYAGKNPVIHEAVTKKLDEMRAELSGANSTPLERLLVERVVATWLHLSHLEAVYANKSDMSLALAGYYQKALSAAQKRHLAAIRGLAEVRRLALPALQVNIARKQVNVVGGPAQP